MGKTIPTRPGAKPGVIVVPTRPGSKQEGWENPHKNFPYRWKGQIHCHSEAGDMEVAGVDVDWNDKPTPEGVLRNYAGRGYHFVCLTDHNRVTKPANIPGMIHILSAEDGRSHAHHIEVLGIDLARAALAQANRFDSNHNGLCDWDTGPCENLPGRLYYYSAIQGAITVLGHPPARHNRSTTNIIGDLYTDWGDLEGDFLLQGFTYEELMNNAQAQYEGRRYSYTGLEVYNAGFGMWATDWWDRLLQAGKRVWGFGGDDSHGVSNNGFNRTWILVNSDKDANNISGAEIIRNIKAGNFYTVVRSPDRSCQGTGTSYPGPVVRISVGQDNRLTVQTEPYCTIYVTYGPRTLHPSGENVPVKPSLDGRSLIGTIGLPEWAKFARVTVRQQKPGDETYLVLSQPLFNKDPQPRPADPCQSIVDRLNQVDQQIAGLMAHSHTGPNDASLRDDLQPLRERRNRIQAELDACRRRHAS